MPLLIFFIIMASSVVKSAPILSQDPPSYELIYTTDGTTQLTGSLTLNCRDASTAEELSINDISFFLNRSSAADPSLRERKDIKVIEVGNTAIRFNLTRRLEGLYTCGRKSRANCTEVIESPPKTLICKSIYICVHDM